MRGTEWLVSYAVLEALWPYEGEVPYSTTEVAASLVVHVMVALFVVMAEAAMLVMEGPVVSELMVTVAF